MDIEVHKLISIKFFKLAKMFGIDDRFIDLSEI